MAFLAGLGTALTAGAATGGAATAIGATAALTAGLGIAQSVKSLISPRGAPKQAESIKQAAKLPAVPKIQDAKVKAREDVAKRRRTIARTGGVTDITKGLAVVPEANIGRKSLIG